MVLKSTPRSTALVEQAAECPRREGGVLERLTGGSESLLRIADPQHGLTHLNLATPFEAVQQRTNGGEEGHLVTRIGFLSI